MAIRETKKSFAYDISRNVEKKGEIFDVDVINQSIENILSTLRGERLFLLSYGSDLAFVLFDNFTETNAEQLLDNILDAIETWEDRIILDRSRARMQVIMDQNALNLEIPYYIKRSSISTTFERKVFI